MNANLQTLGWKEKEALALAYLKQYDLIPNRELGTITTSFEHRQVITFWNFDIEHPFLGYFDFGYIYRIMPNEYRSSSGWYSKNHPLIRLIIKAVCNKEKHYTIQNFINLE